MSRNDARIRMLATLVCGVWLCSCDDAPSDAPAQGANAPKAAASKVPGLPADMVAAVSAGRSSSIISVHFALGNAPTVGNTLPIEIAIVPHQDFDSVVAHFEAHDGLTLASGASVGPLADAVAEKAIKHHLTLMPAREGVYMVTASVETLSLDGSVTRIFSIPVIVGASAAQPAAGATPTDSTPPAPRS